MKNIYILGKKPKYGGPATFVSKLSRYVELGGGEVIYYPNILTLIKNIKNKPNSILIINGSASIGTQVFAKLLGIKVIIRLDGYKYYSKELYERGELLIFTIRKILTYINLMLSDNIIFQSDFVKNTWCKSWVKYFLNKKKLYTIINPVDYQKKKNIIMGSKILCVEGKTGDNYSKILLDKFKNYAEEIVVVGECLDKNKIKGVSYLNKLNPEQLEQIYNEKWLCFLVLENNPACPNSVLEAMSFGIPIVGIDNGSLKEIIGHGSTLISNRKIELIDGKYNYDLDEQIEIILKEIKNNWNYHSKSNMKRIENFRSEIIIDEYLKIISE